MTNTEIVQSLGAIKAVRDIIELGIIPSESVIEDMNKAIDMIDEYIYWNVIDGKLG